MRILAVIQGIYGQRIVDHINANKPSGWQVHSFSPPRIAAPVVDDPDEYLPACLPPADLVLHMADTPQAAQLLPGIVTKTGASGVIAPIDNSAWIPQGLRNQLYRELSRLGATIVYPEPFCSITETTVGFGRTLYTYRCDVIAAFARAFGKPVLDVQVDGDTGLITGATVHRGAPCGSTQYTITRITGIPAATSVPKAGLMCLHYPCLASMTFENTEDGIDTIMHNCGRIFNEAMEQSIGHLLINKGSAKIN
ncbi:MAG: DUF166 family protein [Bacillota bacterium]